jgi:major vault protein
LLDYDETLESINLSTGRPKNDAKVIETAFLKVKNNRISDEITVQTSDGATCLIGVSYCVDFLEEYKNNWFAIENYVKYLCDNMRTVLRKEIKNYSIENFYSNANDIIRNVILNVEKSSNDKKAASSKKIFKDCGMEVKDIEVLFVKIESDVADMLEKSQKEIIKKTLELSNATKKMDVIAKIAEYEKAEKELTFVNKIKAIELDKKYETERLAAQKELDAERRAITEAQKQAELDMQETLNAIQVAELERSKKANDLNVANERAMASIEEARNKAYADTVKSIMSSIQPDLVAALSTKANADLFIEAAKNIGPYAIAGDESISDTINKLMRGTPIEGILDKALSVNVE